MKKILVISGKGGTGKTIISAALISLAQNVISADCDVDASNLHLLLHPKIKKEGEFKNGYSAYIDKNKCIECGKCIEVCRFDAISRDYIVDELSCEGCGFCWKVCPVNAIEKTEKLSGKWYLSETQKGPFSHAKLFPGEENSGKLVTIVKENANGKAIKNKADYMIIDGPPGIGCPVISSISGMDYAIIVTEPTASGIHDAQRIFELAKHFKIKTGIVINKYDINVQLTEKIIDYAQKNKIKVLSTIPFDKCVINAVVNGKTVLEEKDCESIKNKIIELWKKIKQEIANES